MDGVYGHDCCYASTRLRKNGGRFEHDETPRTKDIYGSDTINFYAFTNINQSLLQFYDVIQ